MGKITAFALAMSLASLCLFASEERASAAVATPINAAPEASAPPETQLTWVWHRVWRRWRASGWRSFRERLRTRNSPRR
jgi:hypothetical protein